MQHSQYQFTNSWFESTKPIWDQLIPAIKPQKILEVGTYEGASVCHLIDSLTQTQPIEIHCIDSWAGGVEHQKGGALYTDMNLVE